MRVWEFIARKDALQVCLNEIEADEQTCAERIE
jgi:predicted nucleic acid-binding Zn ribbon protein